MRITPCEGWPRRSAQTKTSAVTAACSSESPALRKISRAKPRSGSALARIRSVTRASSNRFAGRVATHVLRRTELNVPFLVGVLDEAVVLLEHFERAQHRRPFRDHVAPALHMRI